MVSKRCPFLLPNTWGDEPSWWVGLKSPPSYVSPTDAGYELLNPLFATASSVPKKQFQTPKYSKIQERLALPTILLCMLCLFPIIWFTQKGCFRLRCPLERDNFKASPPWICAKNPEVPRMEVSLACHVECLDLWCHCFFLWKAAACQWTAWFWLGTQKSWYKKQGEVFGVVFLADISGECLPSKL